MYDLHYGSGDVYGYNAYDTICIAQQFCDTNFSFYTIVYQNNLDSLKASGILGMSPKDDDDRGDLFISKMKKSGIID